MIRWSHPSAVVAFAADRWRPRSGIAFSRQGWMDGTGIRMRGLAAKQQKAWLRGIELSEDKLMMIMRLMMMMKMYRIVSLMTIPVNVK